MTNIGEGFKNIFLAGIGAMAFTAEKGQELIDQLVTKGEITVEQGKQLNEELKHKTSTTTGGLRENALEATMRMMSPEDRQAFAAAAARFAEEQNAADAAKAAEKQDNQAEAENEAASAAEEAEN